LAEVLQITHNVPLSKGRYLTAVEAVVENPDWIFIYAPGAGSNISDPFAIHAVNKLADQRISIIRFQFPFSERGSKSPDSENVLLESWESVANSFNRTDQKIVIGGRSLGGRIASKLTANGYNVDALALFAYPLHAPASPDSLKTEHFDAISVPTFFCSGTKDAFGSPEQLKTASSIIKGSLLHLLDSADHGFRGGKKRTQVEVWDEAIESFCEWMKTLKAD